PSASESSQTAEIGAGGASFDPSISYPVNLSGGVRGAPLTRTVVSPTTTLFLGCGSGAPLTRTHSCTSAHESRPSGGGGGSRCWPCRRTDGHNPQGAPRRHAELGHACGPSHARTCSTCWSGGNTG